MDKKVKISLPDGREVEATPVNVTQTTEFWNQYMLDDGATIKIKLVASKVFRVDTVYDQEGNPLYIVKSTNILTSECPENLKRKS